MIYKIVYFVPESDLEKTKAALFFAGAGTIGDYDQCCFQTKGKGQFRALKGASPALGEIGIQETVEEYRVELVCKESCIRNAVKALKESHPYEEVAYEVYRLEDI